MKNQFLFIVVLILFSDCTQNAEIDVSYHNERIPTLNCVLYSDRDSIIADLSFSRSIISSEPFEKIDGAKIELFEDSVSVGIFKKLKSGHYLLNYLPNPGCSYTIEASTGEIYLSANVKMPSSVEYKLVRIDTLYNISNFQFNPGRHKDSNLWLSAFYYSQDSDSTESKTMLGGIYSNSLFLDQFNRSIDSWDRFSFLYDKYLKVLPVDTLSVVNISFGLMGQSKYEVAVLAISNDLSAYMKSTILAFNSDMFIDESPLNYSSVQIHSNIEGGIGIFGAINYSSKIFSRL
ncbi:MAG: DUF4249 domain-containing protein [Prolixibacteraceae bacterium]|nr:DUF4249 domain-containing protein [Prolixibacteraceae bacterium]